jgi:hypothetical protein
MPAKAGIHDDVRQRRPYVRLHMMRFIMDRRVKPGDDRLAVPEYNP